MESLFENSKLYSYKNIMDIVYENGLSNHVYTNHFEIGKWTIVIKGEYGIEYHFKNYGFYGLISADITKMEWKLISITPSISQISIKKNLYTDKNIKNNKPQAV
jgi:hypothetical protein